MSRSVSVGVEISQEFQAELEQVAGDGLSGVSRRMGRRYGLKLDAKQMLVVEDEYWFESIRLGEKVGSSAESSRASSRGPPDLSLATAATRRRQARRVEVAPPVPPRNFGHHLPVAFAPIPRSDVPL